MPTGRTDRAAADRTVVVGASELGTIAVSGADRASWLNGLVTCDVTAAKEGTFTYGLALVKVGRILSDLTIGSAGNRLLVGAPRERVPLVREHFEKYLMMEDASLEDVSSGLAWVLAHGPRAAGLSCEAAARSGGWGGAVGTGPSQGGAMIVPVAAQADLLAHLAAEPDVVVVSADAWDELRVALGVPRFGVDFGETNYPHEARLEKTAVAWNKGCYLGQEVVCRLEMRGHVSKRLVAIQLDGGDRPTSGTEIHASDGQIIGRVSSAIPSLALAILPREHASLGSVLSVGSARGVVVES
jgi:tRNA-modifying protein YgfZ